MATTLLTLDHYQEGVLMLSETWLFTDDTKREKFETIVVFKKDIHNPWLAFLKDLRMNESHHAFLIRSSFLSNGERLYIMQEANKQHFKPMQFLFIELR